MSRAAVVRKLFLQFFKFGCFTFGGGWSIVAQMRECYVEGDGTLTNEELLDLTSIGRSIPGTMIGNIAMFYGFRCAGLSGGLACVIGMVLPPMIVLTAITYFYTALQGNVWAVTAMRGVRTAVAPIILSALVSLTCGAFRWPVCVALAAATFGLYFFLDVSCVWLVVLGMVCGVLISECHERKEAAGNDPA